MSQDTICAIATAPGGAIGIIRVSGPEAITVTDRIFIPATGPRLTERRPYTLTFGQIISTEKEVIDEVLVSLFRAPHSYTGENSVEISVDSAGADPHQTADSSKTAGFLNQTVQGGES